MLLRGTPGLGRAVTVPAIAFALAAFGTAAALNVDGLRRPLGMGAASLALYAVYELVRAARRLNLERRRADDWLRAAHGRFVPPVYAWRASQLVSCRHRRMLARTIRLILARSRDRQIAIHQPRLVAVRGREGSLETLADMLEHETVTPRGVLRVEELVADGTGPLWGTDPERLERELETTLSVLRAA